MLAARALAQLAHHNIDNQDSIARMNGVQPLVNMLASSNEAEVQEQAAFALAELCRENALNQQAVAVSLAAYACRQGTLLTCGACWHAARRTLEA